MLSLSLFELFEFRLCFQLLLKKAGGFCRSGIKFGEQDSPESRHRQAGQRCEYVQTLGGAYQHRRNDEARRRSRSSSSISTYSMKFDEQEEEHVGKSVFYLETSYKILISHSLELPF